MIYFLDFIDFIVGRIVKIKSGKHLLVFNIVINETFNFGFNNHKLLNTSIANKFKVNFFDVHFVVFNRIYLSITKNIFTSNISCLVKNLEYSVNLQKYF